MSDFKIGAKVEVTFITNEWSTRGVSEGDVKEGKVISNDGSDLPWEIEIDAPFKVWVTDKGEAISENHGKTIATAKVID